MNKILLVAVSAATVLLTACGGSASQSQLKSDTDTLSYEIGMANAPSEEDIKQYLNDPRTGSDSTHVEDFLEGLKDGLMQADNKKKAAYLAGLNVGRNIGAGIANAEKEIFVDSTKHLSKKLVYKGFKAVLHEKTALKIGDKLVDREAATADVNKRMQALSAAAKAQKFEAEKKASEDFIAKKAQEDGVKRLPGGTLYKVITEGKGEHPKDGQTVNIAYEGKLIDGTVFDKSAQHPGPDGRTIPMVVGQAIPGFDAALKAMTFGSTWEVYIPADQAYNEQGGGKIPPFAALIFTITLDSPFEVQTAPAAH
jgi:FKBP-type peptidyl-prolyl cis-trans isomerase FklB